MSIKMQSDHSAADVLQEWEDTSRDQKQPDSLLACSEKMIIFLSAAMLKPH